MGLTIAQMQLAPNATRAAQLVLAQHPDVVFTSGRRDAGRQAHAMAANVIRYGVGWLAQTYKNRAMVQELTDWTVAHPELASSATNLGDGYYRVLAISQAGQWAQFPHCRGDAFDIQIPRYADGRIDEQETARIKRTIETLPVELGLQLVLTKEGALRLIHAQFNHHVEVPVQI